MSEHSRRDFLKAAIATSAAAGANACAKPGEPSGPKVIGPDQAPVTLRINGQRHDVSVEPRTTLLNVLRNKLDYTGSKEVCDRGACGACTTWVDGKPVVSCLTLAHDVGGKAITTVEGLGTDDAMDPLQQKFVEKDGLQCGFCIPGFLMSIRAVLNDAPNATLEEIKAGCAGNICRCAAYQGMFEAAVAVVKREKPERELYGLSGDELQAVLRDNGVPRIDGPDKVRGRAKYTFDCKLPGMLHMEVLNCPFARAEIESEPDVAAARAVPGVRLVEILTRSVSRIGTEVAVVLAEDPQAAEEAMSVLKVRFKPQDSQVDERVLFETGEVSNRPRRRRQADDPAEVQAAIDGAAHVITREYHVQMMQHSPMEPHGVLASREGDALTIYESSQGIWGVHQRMAEATGLGLGAVKVICEHTGGGFGAKIGPWGFGPTVAEYSKRMGLPIKCMQNRAGELLKGGGRSPAVARITLAADANGQLVAEHRRMFGFVMPYWYAIPLSSQENIGARMDGVGPTPALRAPGAPPPQFISESLMDDMAAEIGMDPLEFRLVNGGRSADAMRQWFDEGTARIGWSNRKPNGSQSGSVVRGYGVGCGAFAGSRGCNFIEVEIDRETGRVRVKKVVAVFEGGFVNKRTCINQFEGGTIMALSWAMTEQRILDRNTGAMLNTNHETYKILGAMDVPEVDVVLIGRQGSPTGVGEAPVVPTAGALSNAIFNALGVRVPRMPFTPKHVLDAIAKV